MNCIVDTNVLMDNIDLYEFDKVYITLPVIQELDKHKASDNEKKKYEARRAFRYITDLEKQDKIIFQIDYSLYQDFPEWLQKSKVDNMILYYAKYIGNHDEDAVLVTNDVGMYETAKCLNIKTGLMNSFNDNEVYKGYIEISGTEDDFNSFFESIDYSTLYVNQYLIFNNTDTGKSSEMRFDGEKFVSLFLPKKIKAKTPLQRCALDLLNNDSITTVAIIGEVGSGKTFLCTQMALAKILNGGLKTKQSKILGIREPKGEGESVGFLKGTFEDKTGKFFKPIEQQLNGGEQELQSLIMSGILDVNIPFYMKGTTYNSTIMVVDEAEDLKESQIKLIGTRVGEDTRIFFSGDYKQSIFNKTSSNPLIRMGNELKGNPKFGLICLDEDVRSETSKMFANLFI